MVLATTADEPMRPDLGAVECIEPAFAARNAALAPVELREHGVQPAALGDVEAMRAIGSEYEIVGAQPIANADATAS